MAVIAGIFILGYFYPLLYAAAKMLLLAMGICIVIDSLMLFRYNQPVQAGRNLPKRLSNGDPNHISITLSHVYPFHASFTIIDELPFQFQRRNHHFDFKADAHKSTEISYELTPTQRGEYSFGALNVYASSPLGLVERRLRFNEEQSVPVYPSFIQMRQLELKAISDQLQDVGIKKIRRIGHTMEFDQIREYVRGDDVRSINWKATARANDLMVNQYRDERSQQIYSVIDTGRVMKMPFEGLSLLDYAINSSLAISNIALTKHDKAGFVTFGDHENMIVPAQKKRSHIYRIQEALYNVETNFMESDFNRLLTFLHNKVHQRSLILLYTNFQTLSSMKRKLPVLKHIASKHLLVNIFFINTELDDLLDSTPEDEEDIYIKTMAEKFAFEKRSIVRILNQHGIQTILTRPQDLSVNTINKYLELKARGLI
ncbi:Uncharacterized conserved protein, DUF58 family, contains vWF domain [Fodinibius salinus]|uniref:Uncharacterized conserved protein, DUF58 family, contains vWF domain n=1 Tax=Fodinibius salinus TaxID=860790 RepID=A0A5D3YIU3_9BACT|nr:DUF58 domain-containing protein [Fodinibius salinus]TYP92655.1 Uncharacterized conserved protein, DUF58 family, contains vWF domain [Fodinibius salinus]